MLSSVNNTPVYPISLGGAGLGSCEEKVFFSKPVSDHTAIETVLFALENKINLIDTSPFYGNSEKKIGIALKEYNNRQSIILSTKAGTHPVYGGYSAEKLQRSIDSSLKTLNTDYLDILHIHDPAAKDLDDLLGKGGAMDVLLRMKKEKIILNIGLGVRDHDLHRKFMASGYADVIMPYMDYNLLRTSAEGLLQEALKNDVGVMVGSALCMGLLSGKDPAKCEIVHYDIAKEGILEKATEVYNWCLENSIDILSLNYRFILDNPAINTIVIGAASKDDVAASLKAYKEPIDTIILESFKSKFISQTKLRKQYGKAVTKIQR